MSIEDTRSGESGLPDMGASMESEDDWLGGLSGGRGRTRVGLDVERAKVIREIVV